MNACDEIIRTLALHKHEMSERFKVRDLGIFGSYIHNAQKKRSDVDILVEFKEPVGLFEFMDLQEYLERLLARKVDLVSKKALKPRIGKRILQEVVYI
jgi:predicted nucleotidyltransferase